METPLILYQYFRKCTFCRFWRMIKVKNVANLEFNIPHKRVREKFPFSLEIIGNNCGSFKYGLSTRHAIIVGLVISLTNKRG